MIKLIVTDLDDTLLRTDKTISEYTKSVLSRCRDAGIKIAYATGRSVRATSIIPSEIFDGTIFNNGAFAMDGERKVYDCPVPDALARALIKSCGERGLNAEFSPDNGKLYVEDCSIGDAEFIKAQLPNGLHMYITNDKIAMIMHKDATKSKGLAKLARRWGIAASEIVAFGDDLNDIDMLSYAGIGVAMENALPEVKAVADLTTLSNGEDGVAVWLATNVL